jgi:hypothetical protein
MSHRISKALLKKCQQISKLALLVVPLLVALNAQLEATKSLKLMDSLAN